jgi:hypothetical protein
MNIPTRTQLLLSLQRALLGAVHPVLRCASIEADETRSLVRLRFECEGELSSVVRESLSIAAAEVASDLASGWQLDEQHIMVVLGKPTSPLSHVAYRRWEAAHAA